MKTQLLTFNDISQSEKDNAPNNGSGKEFSGYLHVSHNGETIALHSDAMEPEDCRFYRDLSWIEPLLHKVFNLGRQEALEETLPEHDQLMTEIDILRSTWTAPQDDETED